MPNRKLSRSLTAPSPSSRADYSRATEDVPLLTRLAATDVAAAATEVVRQYRIAERPAIVRDRNNRRLSPIRVTVAPLGVSLRTPGRNGAHRDRRPRIRSLELFGQLLDVVSDCFDFTDQSVDPSRLNPNLEQLLANRCNSGTHLSGLRVELPAHIDEAVDCDDAPCERVGDSNMPFEDVRGVAILGQPLG